jgi:hypothetical protein
MERQNVLELCPLPSCINIDYIKEQLFNYMASREEYYKKSNRSYYIEDEFSEFWIAESTCGKTIGKGNVATDVITSTMDGIDVMCVCMCNGLSNEKSLMQNFKDAGLQLDGLFKNKEDELAIQLFINNLKKKLNDVIKSYSLNNLYILSYITIDNSVYLCSFIYNIDLIDNVRSSGFSKQGQSIGVVNFIDEKYGKVILYKAKKRLELRLSKKCITENPYVVKIY